MHVVQVERWTIDSIDVIVSISGSSGNTVRNIDPASDALVATLFTPEAVLADPAVSAELAALIDDPTGA